MRFCGDSRWTWVDSHPRGNCVGCPSCLQGGSGMNTQASAGRSLENAARAAEAAGASAQWSNWSRCESSFSLLLVPHRAGVFVLAEEIAPVGADARMLAVFHVGEADDLAR